MRAKYPTHLIFHAVMSLLISGDGGKLFSAPLCSFLHPPVTSSSLRPIAPLGTVLETRHYAHHVFILLWENKFEINTKQQANV